MSEPVTVVGIGADGWNGLTPAARDAIGDAEVLMGSRRQLDLVPEGPSKVEWPSPLMPALEGLLAEHRGRRICVLASGDPTYHGIGTTLARLTEVRVIPHVSSISLACARLNWAQEDVAVVRSADLLHPRLQPGRRILVLGSDGRSVMKILAEHGYADSRVRVLERLGAPDEGVRDWSETGDPLNVVAVECRAEPGTTLLTTTPGLPDAAFENDGQLTKRDVRAIVLSRLAPVPGQLLWDVGAGAGSIAIEWSRMHPSCRAIAVERDPERAARIGRNAAALGVPGVRVVEGAAPEALTGLETPDAVFIGGGASSRELVDACWDALRPGGRLAVSAVTIETEAVLAAAYAERGGDLVRILVQHASGLGGMTGWRPAMPVTVWSVTR
jgi:precorrin-6B C5,15-methyltransferase / cobalt-precorrin-6B C5,C15-methyltransferase